MTFFTFDDELPPDTREVLEASALLQITEFHLFELAYARWHGGAAESSLLERHYAVYMFKEVVPPWVRQYCREVIEVARNGALDPSRFGVLPVHEDMTMARKGVGLGLIVVLVMVTLHAIAMLVAHY